MLAQSFSGKVARDGKWGAERVTQQNASTDFVQNLKDIGGQWRSSRASGSEASGRQAQINAHIEQQLLFEKWVKEDSWLLRDEALPLLLGAAPGEWAVFLQVPERQADADRLWSRLQECVRQSGSPRLVNSGSPVEQWRVSPADLHGWASSVRVPLPAAYDLLMSFIRKTVNADGAMPEASSPFALGQGKTPAGQTGTASAREEILGAALTMLANFPGDCRDGNGFAEGHRIASLILQRQAVLFAQGMPEMSEGEIGDLLDRWVRALE